MRRAALRFEDRGTQDLSRPQFLKDVVSFNKRERRRLGPDSGLWGNFEKIQSILAREIGHRHELPFFPKQVVRKARNIAHVDARAYHLAALAYRAQRRRHQFSGGSVDDGRIEWSVRQLARRPGPHRAE